MSSILDLNPQNYQQHAIHGADRIWTETNCYVDVLIELIHALGHDPIAALPFSLSIDFEEDQWTFFKYPLGDLLDIYGFDVQELNPWKNLAEHIEIQVGRGNPVLVELDSFFLPDTVGSAYKLEHVKSTVAVNEIDVNNAFMGYFHGQGYFELQGEDFENIFQTKGLVHDRMLPPYIEFIKLQDEARSYSREDVRKKSVKALERQIKLIPISNPFEKFSEKFEAVLPQLLDEGMESFHKYSFATFRQFGACFELAATYLQWLQSQAEMDLEVTIENYLWIAEAVKAIQFQFARAVARKKPIDFAQLHEMAKRWQTNTSFLRGKYIE